MASARVIDDLVSRLAGLKPGQYEYLEVKQLAEILARHRAKAREALAEYRSLKKAAAAETDAIERLYLNYEGMFLRDHLRDALRLYVMINHDFHAAYRSYMDGLKAEVSASPAQTVMPAVSMPLKLRGTNDVTKTSHRRLKRA